MILNKIISLIYESERKPIKWKDLNESIYDLFKKETSELSLVFLVAGNNIVSKAIRFFTGKYSHVVLNWYDENLMEKLSKDQKSRLQKKLLKYYDLSTLDPEKINEIKCLVLASMDETGSEYFNFSRYNTRKFDIVKLDFLTEEQKKQIIDVFLSKEVMKIEYDYTGLIFWPINYISDKIYSIFFDDKKRDFCSEIYPRLFKKLGIKICDKENPSPMYLYKYILKKYK